MSDLEKNVRCAGQWGGLWEVKRVKWGEQGWGKQKNADEGAGGVVVLACVSSGNVLHMRRNLLISQCNGDDKSM